MIRVGANVKFMKRRVVQNIFTEKQIDIIVVENYICRPM